MKYGIAMEKHEIKKKKQLTKIIKITLVLLLMEKNPAPVDMVVYPIIYRVSYMSGGCLGFLNHQQYLTNQKIMFGVGPFGGCCGLPSPPFISRRKVVAMRDGDVMASQLGIVESKFTTWVAGSKNMGFETPPIKSHV